MTCGYDYMSDDLNNRSYIIFVCVFDYLFPMVLVFFYYSSIVKAVWAHEESLKAQAKKMNVESLRSNQVLEHKILLNILCWAFPFSWETTNFLKPHSHPMASTGVTNAHGPSPQPAACNMQTTNFNIE